jgi:hypothetical protein
MLKPAVLAATGPDTWGKGSGLIVAIMASVCCLAGVSALVMMIAFLVRRWRTPAEPPDEG